MMCQLSGLDVSNASLYEGGTAVNEAILLAMRSTGRHEKVVFCGGVHPEYIEVTHTNTSRMNVKIEVARSGDDGLTDASHLQSLVDDKTAAVIIQQPNFWGSIEDAKTLVDTAHEHGAIAIMSFDPISVGVLKKPADYNVRLPWLKDNLWVFHCSLVAPIWEL